jgi:SHS2 domain-containing protein
MIGDKKIMGFEEVEHTADNALHIVGRNMKELLSSAAKGMTRLMVTDASKVPAQVEKFIELDAIDAESLLVDWLSELAYWAEAEMLIFKKFNFQNVTSTHLQANVLGGKVAELQKHIKAVTYHNLSIVETSQGLTATIVFDV